MSADRWRHVAERAMQSEAIASVAPVVVSDPRLEDQVEDFAREESVAGPREHRDIERPPPPSANRSYPGAGAVPFASSAFIPRY